MTAALIPGGGQVYNGKYLKGAVIFGLESLALYSFYDNNQKYNNWNETDPLRQQRYLEKRNKYAWWAVFIYIYGLLDAMVDAHLMTFDDKMDEDIGVTTYDDTIKVEFNKKEEKINSLRRFKDDVKEVTSGYECGIGVDDNLDIKEGDKIVVFDMEKEKQKL